MIFSIVLVALCIILTAAGQILLKKGMNQIGAITSVQQMLDFSLLLKVFTNVFVITGILCFGLMLIFWMFALSGLDISSTYPFTSIVYILTAFAALLFLKENISLIQWVGMFLIVGGCILLANR